jgi:hypothetical protein
MRYPVNEIYIANKFSSTHRGIDLGFFDDYNQPVYSANSGKVISIQKQATGGNVIHIRHTKQGMQLLPFVSEYAHLKTGSICVKVGDYVKQGQQIALMGNTGKVSGYHLHYGLYSGTSIDYKVDKWLNPVKYLCVYKGQQVYEGTKKLYSLNYTKIARGIPKTEIGEAMYIRHNNKEIVGKIYNGDEVEYFGTKRCLPSLTKLAVVNNLLEYTSLNKYLYDS